MAVFHTISNMPMLHQRVEVMNISPGLYCRTHFHG